MTDYDSKQQKSQKPIDITTDSFIHNQPVSERDLAQIVINEYAQSAVETGGWSDYQLSNINYFDDTDGSDMHENRPGIEAKIMVKAPSGKTYVSSVHINQEAHFNTHNDEPLLEDDYTEQDLLNDCYDPGY